MHWRRKWQPTPVSLPGESQERGSLVGCCLWGRTESDSTERLHFHFSLSCIGEGNGNPLQCSCLENPRNGGAWWAAVSGVAQSQTRLKRLRSSSLSRRSEPLGLPSPIHPQLCASRVVGTAPAAPTDCPLSVPGIAGCILPPLEGSSLQPARLLGAPRGSP